MKIAYTSDLHTDITKNNGEIVSFLTRRIREVEPDVFIIGGDVANSLDGLNSALSQFKDLSCLKIMVPGNHDIWIESKSLLKKGKDSLYKYRKAIPEVCALNNFIYPVSQPFLIDDTAFIGNIGWYDYTLKDKRLGDIYSTADYDKGSFTKGTWNDCKYAVWLKNPESNNWKVRSVRYSPLQVFDIMMNELRNSVALIPKHVKRVVFIFHTAPFAECIEPKDEPSPFDAYEGSGRIGEYLKELAPGYDISVVCGHRHKKLFLEKENIKVYRSPIGYLENKVEDFELLVKDVIGIFDI
jgi:predicted phosphohydrolase